MATITVDTSKMQMVGDNIVAAEVDGKLVLVVDKAQEIGLSSSGKMMGVASTGGFTAVAGLKANIYIGRKI